MITFTVAGMAPAPQGSKRWVGNAMVESCKQVKPWRYLVQQAAIATNQPTITSPVSLTITFLFPRPKSHFTSKGTLRPSAPTHHSTRPDASKCLRSTEDALVDAGLLRDDALVALASITKRYTTPSEHPGAIITIIPLNQAT